MAIRHIYLLAIAACVSLLLSSTARAQYKLETCEDLKITKKQYGANIVDKQVELNIRDMSQGFSGRIRMSGAILKVAA